MNRIHDIRMWAYARNLVNGSTAQAQTVKLMEEMGELASGVAKNRPEVIADSIGDCIVVLTIIAEQMGFALEACIEDAWEQIKDRKGKMVNGIFIKEEDL